MKRTISILLTALVAFGCAKEELAVLETSGNTEVSSGIGVSPINFAIKNGLENWGTKASVVEGFATGDAISVAAFQNTDECFNEAITNTTGGWVMSEGRHYYWESYNAEYNGTDALDFCFVYPEQTIRNKSFTYTLGANPDSQEDLLVRYLAGTKASADYSPVNVVMDHALSLLAFEVKTKSGDYKVESITVNNTDGFYDTGVYTFDSGWGSLSKANSVKSISSPIKVADVSSSDYTDVNKGNYCFLIPQSATITVDVRYSNGTDSQTISAPSFSENFEAGEKYTYRISLPAILSKLATPTLSCTATATTISASWDAIDGATGYTIYYGSGEPFDLDNSTTNYVFRGLDPENEYTIYVIAKGDNVTAANSNPGHTVITTKGQKKLKPSITLETRTNSSLKFIWDCGDDESGVRSYDVYWGNSSTPVQSGSSTSYTANNLTRGTEYTIYVVANGDDDEYLTSDKTQYKGTTKDSDKKQPDSPVIKGSIATESSIAVDWYAVTWPENGSGYYQISLSPDNFSGSISGTSGIIMGLEPDTWYDVYVRAVMNHGSYDPSDPVKIRIKTEAVSQNLFYGAIGNNTTVEIKEGSKEYAILMNSSTNGFKVTYSFTESDNSNSIMFTDGYHNPLPNATIGHPGDAYIHSTNISINDNVRQTIVDHNNFMKIVVPWSAYILKIEYY